MCFFQVRSGVGPVVGYTFFISSGLTMACPAQKPLPLAFRMTTFTSSSRSAHLRASSKSHTCWAVWIFAFSGVLRTIRAIGPSFS